MFGWEARRYGADLTQRLHDKVVQLDTLASRAFDPKLYARLHHQPLARLDLPGWPEIQQLSRNIEQTLRNPQGIFALFTDCPESNQAYCYEDFLI